MRLLLILCFAYSLYGNDSLLELYQKQGIQSIENAFDQTLSSTEYWQKRLADINTSFGYFESIDFLLSCDKNSSQLKFYTKDNNNSFSLHENFSAYVGAKKGDKQKEGDLKTPIGVYRLIQKLEKVDSFYGPLAFVTSYPNTYDKVQGKNGSGIWVHGLPLHQKRDDFTRGCIAINNTSLEHLDYDIDANKTIVYIDEQAYPEVQKKQLILLLSQLYQWKKAWRESDIDSYLDFYSPCFKRNDGMDYQHFANYKRRIFAKQEYKHIHFTDINILPYPHSSRKNTFFISFKEQYRSPSYQFDGAKELYVQLTDHKLSILTEK